MKRTPLKRGKPPKRKTSARKMKQELDLAIKFQVLFRDGHQCVVGENGARCKATSNLHAAHVRPKGKYPRLRFEPDNLLSMCFFHHIVWAHRDPLAFADWFRATYPERDARLRELAQNAGKLDLKELYEQARHGVKVVQP
jgi:hypothetical protein